MANMTRLEAIRAMYQYEAKEEDVIALENGEIIDNWYIIKFPNVEDLEKLFNLEDLYDFDLDAKVYIKDIHS